MKSYNTKMISTLLMIVFMLENVGIGSTNGIASHEEFEIIDNKLHVQSAQLVNRLQEINEIVDNNPEIQLVLHVFKADGFVNMDGLFQLDNKNIPRQLKHLSIVDEDQSVTTIGDYFFFSCQDLTSVNLNFNKLKRIGNYFLFQCPNLTSVNLNFNKLIIVGECFLANCASLLNIDLNFSNLRQIGFYFLFQCPNLTSANLNFSNLTTIGDYFLLHCHGLTSANLNFQNLTRIGKLFLAHCPKLVNIQFTSNMPPEAIRLIGQHIVTSFQNSEVEEQKQMVIEIQNMLNTMTPRWHPPQKR